MIRTGNAIHTDYRPVHLDRHLGKGRRRIHQLSRIRSLAYLPVGRKSSLQHLLESSKRRTAQEILEIFILLMRARLKLDTLFRWFGCRPYRPYFEGFHGCCQFVTRDDSVKVFITFDNGRVTITEGLAPGADVTITYTDGLAVMNCLLSPIWNIFVPPKDRTSSDPPTFDVLDGVLNNTIQISGNPSYLFRFGFLANHLLLELTGELPKWPKNR
jgi:hypothetical protein